MLTSIRGLAAASFATGLVLSATPALAGTSASEKEFDLATIEAAADVTVDLADLEIAMPEVDAAKASKMAGESGIEVSGNVALVSEYRFRGVDLSGGEIAIQGGIDLSHSSGFYMGTWASSLDEDTVGYGSTEVDVYGGWGGDLTEGLSVDVGVIAYLYPDAKPFLADDPNDFDYIEFYGSLGFAFGPAEATVGVAYAPDQDSLGSTDNFYIYTDLGVGVPGTPLTLTGHLGYTDGFLTFTDDGKAFDWSIGAEAAVYGPVSIGVAYVGVEGAAGTGVFTDDAIVFTLSASI